MEGCDAVQVENNDMTVLLDPSTYIKSIYKDASARWVHGLTPEDEDPVGRREHTRAPSTKRNAAVESAASLRGAHALLRSWLRVPVVLGISSLVVLVHAVAVVSVKHALDFPKSEEELLGYVPKRQDGIADFLGKLSHLWGTSFLFSLFGLTLSWTIGCATGNFCAISGVGLSILSLIATVGQLAMLWQACDLSVLSGQEECDVPFVLYWTLSVMRLACPLLAVWCVSPVLDAAQGTLRWRVTLALPVVGLGTSVAFLALHEERLLGLCTLYALYYLATFVAWFVLIYFCVKQKNLRLGFEKKQHTE